MTNNINAMKKAIIIVSILFTSVLAWGQDMAMFPNVSFENNYDGMQTTDKWRNLCSNRLITV